MKQLEMKSGEWSIFIEERPEGNFTPIKRDTLEEGANWIATHEPLKIPYSSARQLAAEYAGHVVGVQDSEVRDSVFVGCVSSGELEKIVLL